ncbi:hypothetical protein PG985_001784 [Apiospora marii]|uniref:2EXR domain-containing protein n=1 Tax=Apiospora marii TaxID=335849 RepID=A0ABR1RZI3_9PEZI
MESSVDSIIATSFHCFPRLPSELRRIVWGLAVFPRTITCAAGPRAPVPGDDNCYEEDPWEGWHWTMYCYGTLPPPPLLQACSESRSVAISDGLYRAQLWPAWVRIPQSPRYTWVNYEFDTIQLPSYLLPFLGLEDKVQIRSATIDGGDHWKALDFFTHFHFEKDMIYMQSLRELRILTGDHVGAWGDAFRSLQSRLEERFGGKPGWAAPKITIVHKITGGQADESNIDEKHGDFVLHHCGPFGTPRTILAPWN